MKSKLMLKIIFVVLFGIIAGYNLEVYIDHRNIVQSSQPIDYIFAGKKIKKGGRGVSYEMKVFYKDREYKLNITSKTFEEIGTKKFPVLYYSEQKDTVFSLWEIKKSLRVTILFFAGFILLVLPIHKFIPKRLTFRRDASRCCL